MSGLFKRVFCPLLFVSHAVLVIFDVFYWLPLLTGQAGVVRCSPPEALISCETTVGGTSTAGHVNRPST